MLWEFICSLTLAGTNSAHHGVTSGQRGPCSRGIKNIFNEEYLNITHDNQHKSSPFGLLVIIAASADVLYPLINAFLCCNDARTFVDTHDLSTAMTPNVIPTITGKIYEATYDRLRVNRK